ncbi:hypothetical protein Q3G72_026935 [Acer saccharum]|nr:hypothetical protein Q3G72_026935 [Acer saccharum]
MKLSDAKKDILEVDKSLSIQIDFFTKIGVFDDNDTSKHQSQWDFEKLRGVIQSTPKCFAEVDEVYSKLIEIYGIYQKMKLFDAKKDILEVDESLSIQIDFFTKIGVFDDNDTSKHQSQWDFEKLRGVIQSTPKVEEVIDQELMIAFNGGRFSLNKSLFEHYRDGCVVFVGSGVCADDETKTEDVEIEVGVCADDEAKANEVENSSGVNAESVVCADDEAKADEVDTEIGDYVADNEAKAKEVDTKIGVFDDNGISKHQSQWDFEKLSGICADDEAKTEDVETEIGVFDDDKDKAEEGKKLKDYYLRTLGRAIPIVGKLHVCLVFCVNNIHRVLGTQLRDQLKKPAQWVVGDNHRLVVLLNHLL